ncbi:carboxypeptidase-like regulatory domain-containing protein [Streptomyces sp. ACA25]|uniref:carboxypeptidase-like regulatory domain-containing protein n=1 Tax=Streptomyces sp. ACA25 TaxID=3022596 RepID=UPI0023074C38|nr:carboxypeptidase-like regulatory domain-containing protein [Streptomyces sp. ACA25]MDB1087076.1 carboxypeptidase-like regulatory domain-containing protein [Streptomyces sp. ACA25]
MADSLARSTDDEVPPGGPVAGDAGVEPLIIRGIVRDSLGVALPRAVVTLAGDGGRQYDRTRSALDGGFEVTAPDSGDYQLAAFSPQLGSQSVDVTLDGRPVEVEFRITVPGAVAD